LPLADGDRPFDALVLRGDAAVAAGWSGDLRSLRVEATVREVAELVTFEERLWPALRPEPEALRHARRLHLDDGPEVRRVSFARSEGLQCRRLTAAGQGPGTSDEFHRALP